MTANRNRAGRSRRGVTLIEVAIVALALLLAVAGARFGWERWHLPGAVLGAVCGFVAGVPVGGIITLISVASVLFAWPFTEKDVPLSPSQIRIEELGCAIITVIALLAGFIGWTAYGALGGIFGLALGVPAAIAVFSVVVRFCIWTAGVLRWRPAGRDRGAATQRPSEDDGAQSD